MESGRQVGAHRKGKSEMKTRKQTTILFLAVSLLCMTGQTSAERSGKPNVLFIAIDDLNDWLTPLGGNPQVITPNFDKLAKEGMLFTNAFLTTSSCSPSRTCPRSWHRPGPGRAREAAMLTSIRRSGTRKRMGIVWDR